MSLNSSFRNFQDAIASVLHNAGQCCHELTEMATNLAQIEPAVTDLRDRAGNFSPTPERQGLRAKENVTDPVDELARIKARLRYVAADLDRAAVLLAERRAALAALIA